MEKQDGGNRGIEERMMEREWSGKERDGNRSWRMEIKRNRVGWRKIWKENKRGEKIEKEELK